jgi:hypothetical protein
MKLIESKTLGTAQASIEFTSIPQDGTDLVAVISARSARSGAVDDDLVLSFNSNTSNFSIRRLYGTGSTAASITTPVRFAGYLNGNGATSNTFSTINLYIPNYTGSTAKSYSTDSATENNATESYQDISAGLWNDTAAITSIAFTSNRAQNLLTGSTISLYKITKGSDGLTVVS